jgi:tRNA threonylcarbamoyladenosine biosynthesis protein TsaE
VVLKKLGPREFSEAELVGWGELIGRSIEPPLWVALYGPLGAGKSVLARAICRGAGITSHIPSPSFTLVQQYASPRGFEILHVDLFRLRPGDRIEPLGWDDLLGSTGVVLLEWADRSGDQQPEDRWDVRMDYAGDPSWRVVTVDRLGQPAELISW